MDVCHEHDYTGYTHAATLPTNGLVIVAAGKRTLFNYLASAELYQAPNLYNICPLYDSSKAVKSGSTVPIKLQLCNTAGVNMSSSSMTLNAQRITQVSTSTDGGVQVVGNANPDNNFRFDPLLGSTGGLHL